jgi:hypothetical protein
MFLKSCSENQNTHFIFSDFFPENGSLWDNVETFGEHRGVTTSQHAHTSCMLDKKDNVHVTRMHTPMHPGTRTRATTNV